VTIEKNPRVLCADLLHHERTVEKLKLKPETYREWEWTRDDDGTTLAVRAAPGENPSVLKSAILAKFASRLECLNECIRQIVCTGGVLYLGSLTSLDPAVKLPESVGGYLDLRSLTSLDPAVKLPESVGGSLHLGSLTSLDPAVKLPKSVGGHLYLGSLTSLENVPKRFRKKIIH
jgi:hypothetical protein